MSEEKPKGWVTAIMTGLLAAAGVLLFILGPEASHLPAAGALTGAVAVASGAFRR